MAGYNLKRSHVPVAKSPTGVDLYLTKVTGTGIEFLASEASIKAIRKRVKSFNNMDAVTRRENIELLRASVTNPNDVSRYAKTVRFKDNFLKNSGIYDVMKKTVKVQNMDPETRKMYDEVLLTIRTMSIDEMQKLFEKFEPWFDDFKDFYKASKNDPYRVQDKDALNKDIKKLYKLFVLHDPNMSLEDVSISRKPKPL